MLLDLFPCKRDRKEPYRALKRMGSDVDTFATLSKSYRRIWYSEDRISSRFRTITHELAEQIWSFAESDCVVCGYNQPWLTKCK
jgi:hypothetical protein